MANGNIVLPGRLESGAFLRAPVREIKQPGRNFHFPEKYGIPSPSFHGAEHEVSVAAALAVKTVGHMDAVKQPGLNFHEHEKTGKPGRSFQSAAVAHGAKTVGHANKRDGHSHTRHLTNQRESDAVKQPGLSDITSRKAASAMIAKIPFPLGSWLARSFRAGQGRNDA